MSQAEFMEKLLSKTFQTLKVLDRSAPGRYAPCDASVGPINMGGKKEQKQYNNFPQQCQLKPDNLTLAPFFGCSCPHDITCDHSFLNRLAYLMRNNIERTGLDEPDQGTAYTAWPDAGEVCGETGRLVSNDQSLGKRAFRPFVACAPENRTDSPRDEKSRQGPARLVCVVDTTGRRAFP